MKKVVTTISALALLASLSGVAYAENASGSRATSSMKQKIEDRKEVMQERMASTTMMRLAKERVMILNNYVEAIRNLKSLASRVQSRINKMGAQGISTSSAQALLDIANTKITVASNDITGLFNVLASTTATSTKKMMLAAIKADALKTKQDIKLAHQALVNAIKSLKPGEEKHEMASTTATSTH